jgi:glycosyltransferase involved in cell wall biosynthesis
VRVLVVSAGIVSDRRPHGEALIAHHILSRLGRRGHEVTAFCTESDGTLPGVNLVQIPAHAPGAALSRLAFARRAARAAAGVQADVHHLLLPLDTSNGYTLVRGAPLVVGPLMLPWPSADGGTRPRSRALSAAARIVVPFERRLHAKTLQRAERLLVTGTPAQRALDERLSARCTEVPYGVEAARFPAGPLPEEPVVLFLSVLLPRKGYDTLLRAWPYVLGRIPRARLVIAGDDPRGVGPEISERARAIGGIEFHGPVAPADVPALFRSARVFCQPSHGEPFGMTILEAMSSGRPVVATAAGGVPGFVREGVNGRLVSPGDERLLADALTSMLSNSGEAVRIGKTNAEHARTFDWDRVVDRIEESYHAVCEEVPRVRVAS